MAVSELERTRVLMSICKLKLGQYHEILTNYIPTDDLRAQQALTGIQEVREFCVVLVARSLSLYVALFHLFIALFLLYAFTVEVNWRLSPLPHPHTSFFVIVLVLVFFFTLRSDSFWNFCF